MEMLDLVFESYLYFHSKLTSIAAPEQTKAIVPVEYHPKLVHYSEVSLTEKSIRGPLKREGQKGLPTIHFSHFAPFVWCHFGAQLRGGFMLEMISRLFPLTGNDYMYNIYI